MSGNSTLSDSVSPNVGTQVTYDLKSWQGLTAVLKDGKNALRPDVYAEFRNLILQYAQHGGDVEYKKRVDAIIATFAGGGKETTSSVKIDTISPLTDTSSTESAKVETAVTSRRIQPRFDTPAIPQVKRESEHPDDTSIIQRRIQITPEPITIEPLESESEVVIQESNEDEEDVDDLSEPASKEISFLPKEIFEPETTVIPEVAPVISSPEEYKKRIAEIKRTVNAHYENPVALMAAPGGLGKTYMNALLVALKAVGPGVIGDPAPAMNQLEKAFDALLHIQTPKATTEIIAQVEEKSSVPEFSPKEIFHEPQKDLTPIVEDIPQKISDSIDETIVANPDTEAIVSEVIAPVIPQVATTEEVQEEDVPDSINENDIAIEEDMDGSSVDVAPKPVTRTEQILHAFEKTDSLISSVVSSVHKSLENNLSIHEDDTDGGDSGYTQSDKHVEQNPSPTQSETNQHTGTETKTFQHNKWTKKEIGKTTSVEKIKEKGFDTSKNEVKQAELYAPKTTAMLNNLLHEWSIFSASGFLGTGPSGAEHPLFVTLAPLSMGEVIAGRWEGVDPKQLKIIKQYVDAWRHEQGLTYTLSETFEHYLRRVVDRIAKRQNG
jgi:hypothetical protein